MGAFIVIAGGGTGGHVFPGLAIARALARRDPGREFLFVGSDRGLETRLVPAAGFPLKTLPLGGMAGLSAAKRARAFAQAILAVARCIALFARRRPRLVVGVGGFASGPAVLAGCALRVPTLIQEQNAVPGLTNRWLARIVDRIALSFPGSESAFGGKGTVTGNPVREAFAEIPPYPGSSGPLKVLIFGGSRGAHTLNRAAVDAFAPLWDLRTRLAIVLQTGEAEHAQIATRARESGLTIEVAPFLDDMPARLAWADLVVCRSGAGTVFELAAAGRASVLVPYPHAAGGHQAANAAWMERADAATVVPDEAFTGERLAAIVREALDAPGNLALRAAAARTLSRPRAADEIAGLCDGLIIDRRGRRGRRA